MRIFAAKLNEGTARFPQLVVINGEINRQNTNKNGLSTDTKRTKHRQYTDYDTDRNDNIRTTKTTIYRHYTD